MPNVTAFEQIRNFANYEPAALSDALDDMEFRFGKYEHLADGITFAVPSDALTATAVAVKASAGKVYLVYARSPAGSTLDSFLMIYNTAAASVTAGTTAPRDCIFVPSLGAVAIPIHSAGSAGRFGTAISVASATTFNGATGPAAADRLKVAILYA